MGKLTRFTVLIFTFLALVSCQEEIDLAKPSKGQYDRVMIMVSAGYNNLSSYLTEDLKDLSSSASDGYLPLKGSGSVLLSISHMTDLSQGSSQVYKTDTDVNIVNISRDFTGAVLSDTLLRIPAIGNGISQNNRLTNKDIFQYALQWVKEHFPSSSYGMVYSSHATGWLPCDYYSKQNHAIGWSSSDDDGWADGIAVKSIGAETYMEGARRCNEEMEIDDFASSIPMHLDYIIFDACLMGGVEVAYQLKDVADYIAFSQAEVGAEGFCYELMARRLLCSESIELEQVCSDYYEKCASNSSEVYRSATVSLVDCSALDALADACRSLFEDYREGMENVRYSEVQGFFRYDKHFFYDLRDIMDKSDISSLDMSRLDNALNACIIYKATTPKVLADFDVRSFCGLSMYLPAACSKIEQIELDAHYRSLAWNRATSLLK